MSFFLACILSVYDGDSLTLCSREKLRLINVDAPELRGSPQCAPKRRRQKARTANPAWCDHKLGIRSRDALRAFVMRGRVKVRRQGKDRFGRTLASVTVNGVDAGAWLISRGLARRWKRP